MKTHMQKAQPKSKQLAEVGSEVSDQMKYLEHEIGDDPQQFTNKASGSSGPGSRPDGAPQTTGTLLHAQESSAKKLGKAVAWGGNAPREMGDPAYHGYGNQDMGEEPIEVRVEELSEEDDPSPSAPGAGFTTHVAPEN